MSALESLPGDVFAVVASMASVHGWLSLLKTSPLLRTLVMRWRWQAHRPWPWTNLELYLCAGRELSHEEADEVDDAAVHMCLSLAGRPVHLFLHGLPLVTHHAPEGPLVRHLDVSRCAVLTGWLRLAGRMDALAFLNDFAPGAQVHAVLGACVRCSTSPPPWTQLKPAIEVCEVCDEVMCRECREDAVGIAGTCFSCPSASICVTCALKKEGPGWGLRPNGHRMYECNVCRS